MLKTEKLREGNRSALGIPVGIQRELTEEHGQIMSILPNCDVSFKRSECCLGAVKSSDVTGMDAVRVVAIECCENLCFECRKRRPRDRRRKKRRKGKWDPIDRLWSSANTRNCSSAHLLGQD
jgi:hypothetical protein